MDKETEGQGAEVNFSKFYSFKMMELRLRLWIIGLFRVMGPHPHPESEPQDDTVRRDTRVH